MIVLVSGGTASLRRHGLLGHVGHLHTPDIGNALGSYWLPYAVDNAAFSGFDAPSYLMTLSKVSAMEAKPLFVTAPDVVCDAAETLRRFRIWGPLINELKLPAAFVGQDGCEAMPIPWDEFECLFVGGSTAWKLGSEATELCIEAKQRGKWVHVGRVNSFKRLRIIEQMGADSFDGGNWNRFGDTYLPRLMRFLAEQTRRRALFA